MRGGAAAPHAGAGVVITAAVAGNESTRKLRACLAKSTCPNLSNRAATAGAVAYNLEKGEGVPPPLEMTGQKEVVVLKTGISPESIPLMDKIKSTPNDTVLIIGQVCFKFFNKNCDLLSEIKGSKVYIMGGTTATDFNITQEGVELLKTNKCEVHTVPSSDCPTYKFVEQWEPLIAKYDEVASDIHIIAVGAFLTSRIATYDGAFYRQFGLANMAKSAGGSGEKIMSFEKNVAVQVNQSDQFPPDIKGKMINIIKYCGRNSNPDYGEGAAGGAEEVYTELYTMWAEALNADTHGHLMKPLSILILKALQAVGSPGGTEYDGYVTAKMLYENSESDALTGDKHYSDLMQLFDSGVCAPEWKTGLDNILAQGNLYVYHDAGLDPYVDDYIALKILNVAMAQREI
jgi:hypothetical protein